MEFSGYNEYIMNRRTFVAVAGTTSTSILAGCGDEGPGGPSEPVSNGDDDATPGSDGDEDATPDSNGEDATPNSDESGATAENEGQESEVKN